MKHYHVQYFENNRIREKQDLISTNSKTVQGWLKVFYRENPNALRGSFDVELTNDGARIYLKPLYYLIGVYKIFEA